MSRPELPPGDHRHGRPSGYRDGCRCTPCRDNWRRKNKSWEARAYRNGGRTTVPAETFLEELRALTATVSQRAVDDAIGSRPGYVSRLLRGEMKSVSQARAANIRRVINQGGVNPADAGGAYVSAVPSTRRLRALSALGYSQYKLEAGIGISRNAIMPILLARVPHIHGDTHAKIAAAYERMSMELPTAGTAPERAAISRARNRADREGWAPPLAWNNIDDPNEKPTEVRRHWHTGPNRNEVDHAVVERLLTGEHIKATRAEKEEALRRWVAAGRPARQFADMHRWHDGRYARNEGAA